MGLAGLVSDDTECPRCGSSPLRSMAPGEPLSCVDCGWAIERLPGAYVAVDLETGEEESVALYAYPHPDD